MKNIAIMGAGGFCTALALVLSRNNHQISLWDIDKNQLEHWQAIGRNDRYPYLANHKFPNTLCLSGSDKINANDFDFIVISSSMVGIKNTLKHLLPNQKTPIALIQKGMLEGLISPSDLARDIYPNDKIIQFTGAAFAKDLANKAPAGMMVVHRPEDKNVAYRFAELFRGSNIWPTCCSDVFGVNIHNALRTIASFEQGFVYGYFEKKLKGTPPVSTIAVTFSAISQETKQIARFLGATKKLHDICSKSHRIIEADLMLCQNDTSRNFALGHFVGNGFSLDKAKVKVTEGVAECINNIGSIFDAINTRIPINEIENRFPYLSSAKKLIGNGKINEQMRIILAHHENFIA